MFHQFRGRRSWRKEVKLEAAKVMKPRSELNPGVWQGDCFPVLIRIARKCFGDRECRCWYCGGQPLIALMMGQKFRNPAMGAPRFSDAARNRRPQSEKRGEIGRAHV